MQEFKHVNAKSFEEASKELAEGSKLSTVAIAGGTDLMTELRTRIQPVYPDKVVNLKSIEGAEYIKEENGAVSVGALTKLKDVEVSDKLPAVLREAAHSVASPPRPQQGHDWRQHLSGRPLLVLPLPRGQRRRAQLRPEGRGGVLRAQGRRALPQHFRRHEDEQRRRLLRRLPEQHGHRLLHGEAARRRLGRRGRDILPRQPHAHHHQPRLRPPVREPLQPHDRHGHPGPVRARRLREHPHRGARPRRLRHGAPGRLL